MDFGKLHAQIEQNTQQYPEILKVLAEELGVQATSLKRLGVTFAPCVQFKPKPSNPTGKNAKGWWATPERGTDAVITGLTLRPFDGGKIKPMWFKSKHGLMYPVRDDFDSSKEVYTHGEKNWVRALNVGVMCPVCDKPDGCLISYDDEGDPKAVICIREKEGSIKPQDFGWLHILSAAGHINDTSPLLASPLPILILEGMSCCAAALDLGFVAIGRPSATYTEGLRTLCRGRKVIIVGENDEPDAQGRLAGLLGMEKAYDLLFSVCPGIKKLLPPDGLKDFRDWTNKTDLTADLFLEYANEWGRSDPPSELLESNEPMPVAKAWLGKSYWDGVRDLPLLRSYGGVWYVYNGIKYEEHKNEDALRGELYRWLFQKRYMKSEDEIATYVPTRTGVHDILDALNAFCPIMQDPPCWIDDSESTSPQDTIIFSNGILHVDRYLAGAPNYLTPLTPAFFTLNALPYDFETDAACPLWLRFLSSTFGDTSHELEKIDLMQEWFGYNMVADMSQEKMMMFVGRSGSGKGTALAGLTALIGEHQIASTKLKTLGEQFGIEPMIGKLAAIMADIRISRMADSMQALETLLQIVGGDAIDIPRKHRINLARVNLITRFTIAANELPKLPDHSQALARRLVFVHFQQNFVGREDTTLKQLIPEEAPGIALWALEGLRRLRSQGKFTDPTSSAPLRDDFRLLTSPVAEFIDECCIMNTEGQVSYRDLFDLWVNWSNYRGMRAGNGTQFQQRVLASFPAISLNTFREEKTRVKRWVGMEIDSSAPRKYS